MESKYNYLYQEYCEVQQKLLEASETESHLCSEHAQREQELVEKLHQSQNEEIRLVEMTTKLEKEVADLKSEISSRDKHLDIARNAFQKIKTSTASRKILAQEEVSYLKNELNSMIQKQNVLLQEACTTFNFPWKCLIVRYLTKEFGLTY